MGLLGLAVGLKAEVVHPPGPIHDLQNRLAPIQGHDLALALDHDPIHALSPGTVQWGESQEVRGSGKQPSGLKKEPWMLLWRLVCLISRAVFFQKPEQVPLFP